MLISTIFGIDLAKNIIQVCQISKHGELVSNKALSFIAAVKNLIAQPPLKPITSAKTIKS